jgi:hypothetical protein
MNKLIIGLLVVAAGAGIFLLLRKKKETTITNDLQKELIIGKWKSDAIMANDSNFSKYQFDFLKDGNVIRSLNDSTKADTSHYEWNKANELVWSGWTPSEKEKATDSTGKVYVLTKLTTDSLQVQTADNSTVLFTKVK